MPDFYVSGASGSDTNPGTSTQPFATITRATEAAAVDDSATGTIFLANGVYGPAESFPILVPPLFALEGESRDGCEIRFSGLVMGRLYRGIAVQGGRLVRGLTMAADPPPSLPSDICNDTNGLVLQVDGCRVENVRVRIASGAAAGASGFGKGVWIKDAVDAWATRLIVDENTLDVSDSDARVWDCELTGMGIGGGGRPTVTACTFTGGDGGDGRVWGGLRVSSESDALIQGNRFVNVGIGVDGSSGSGAGPSILGNVVRGAVVGLWCFPGSRARIETNILNASGTAVYVQSEASPSLLNNRVELDSLIPAFGTWVLRVSSGARPRFDGNVFVLRNGNPLVAVHVSGPADFGGGALGSTGNNHFGQVARPIRFDHPGAVFARNNFWRHAPPVFYWSDVAWYQRGEETTVSVDGALLDSDREP